MSNVVVKQGKPSAPGTVVDTSKAAVVPPSSEVKTESASREAAKGKKATQAKVNDLAGKMTGGKKPAKAKAAKPKRGTGNGGGPVARLTTEWTGKDKKDVAVKDRVKTAEGVVIDVIGRWTRKTKDAALIPMVTGHIVSGAPKGKKVGDRQNAVAGGCTHVKK